jgi:uncharacterized protein (TIGR02285 family)
MKIALFSPVIICFAVICIGASTLTAAHEKKVIWYIFDIRPTHFIDGEEKGSGFADYVQAKLIENMAEYQHSVQIVSVARLVADLKAGKPFCTINGFYGGAPFPTAYSAPYNISRARHVVYLKNKKSEILQGKSSVSFESLITNKKLIFGHMDGAPYHPKINSLLIKHQSKENVFVRSDSSRMSKGLFEMLIKGRIDYMLSILNVKKYYSSRIKGGEMLEAFIPTESKDFLELVAPNCTGGEWGEGVVKDINKVLVKVRPTPEFRKKLEKYHLEPGREKIYRDLYEKEVLTRNEYRSDLEIKQ